MNRQTSQNNTDFERLVRKDANSTGGLSQRMGVPMNAMEVDSDLSDIDEELNENARYGIGMGVNGNQGAQRGHPQIQQQQQMHYGGQQQQQRYGPGQGGPPNQHGFSQQLPVNPSRAASLNGPPQQQQMHAQNPHMQQQQQQQQQGPTPQPPQKKSLFSFGKKKQDDHQNHGSQPFAQPQQIQPMGRPIADPQVTDVNRQKRMSMEKRLSMDQKRMSMDKRGSLEIKLHDGMIIVDEEERKILARKYGSNPSNITTSPTGANVITHNQVQNHFPGGPPPRVLSSPQQQPGMMAPPMPGPGNFDPRMRPPPGMSGPPFNPNMQGSPNSRPMPLGSGPMPGGFQGPPRTGSLNSPPQFSQQYQRPPPPMINQKPSPFMPQQQQQQQAYSMQQQQPLPPQRLSYMGNSVQGGTPPLNLGMPGSQPFRPLPSGPNGPPQPLQLNLRHSPMLFDPLQPLPSGGDQRFVPQQQPQPPQRMPLSSQGPPPQSMPGSMKTAPFEKTPPIIQEEASQQQPQQPQQQQQDLQAQQQQQFTKVDDEDEEYYDDDESVGSFISFDEVTEDNTEYNAIVDYDLLDAVMGGSTDYDALLPRVTHDRKVVFGALVKASTLVRVLADGELLQEGADPDGDTEFETEGDEEDEDEDDEEEEDSDDGRPESPMTEVVSMIPLRPPDQEAAPEIMPRGVSLKLTEGGVAGVGVPGEGLFASMATVGALPAEQFAQQQQYQVPAVAAAVAASKVDRESSPQPPLEPEHESVLPGADATQRKKVRHVQIQTRGATMKTQTTLTEIFGLEQDLDLGFTPDDILGAIEAGGMDASMIPGGNSGVDSAQVEEMESELAFLREQAAALHQAMAAMQAEAAAKQTEAEEKQARFDKLSGQAMRKIKELVAERKVMEIEIDSLRGQVKGLDELVQKWTLDAEEP
ncbi:hypothetical protein HDU77_001199 [Chytriomyces hyalinus]|nr:hypothetical protein HDU77_001199 [Chytriomyces hyalinus]